MRNLAVPPVAIRPTVEMDGASNEDDITMKLMQARQIPFAPVCRSLDAGSRRCCVSCCPAGWLAAKRRRTCIAQRFELLSKALTFSCIGQYVGRHHLTCSSAVPPPGRSLR